MAIELNISKKIFNPVYYPYLYDYTARYNVFFGGAGSGKSHFVFQKVVLKAIKDKRKVLVVRNTAKSNRDSTFQMCLDTLSKFGIYKLCDINKSFMIIKLPNGSQFLFYGVDDVEKLKSIVGITDIICEEATEIDPDSISQLDLRLRAKRANLQMYFMFNPVSKANWVYKRWFADDVKDQYVNDKNTFILKTTYKDNLFLPQAYIDSIEEMKQTNPTMWRIYTLGEFASLDKLIFNNWIVEQFNTEDFYNDKLMIGMDFGYVNDPSTIVASFLKEKEKKIYVFRTWGAKGKTNNELAKAIIDLGFAKSIIIADAAEKKSIEEIRRCGIGRIKPSVKGKDSIVHGIQKLQQYQLVIHPDCEGLIEELQNYAWKKDSVTKEYINTPIDKWNHYIDALRYSLQSAGIGKMRVLNKNVL